MTGMSGKWDDKIYQIYETKAEYDKEYKKEVAKLNRYVRGVKKGIKGGDNIVKLANSAIKNSFYGDKGNTEVSTLGAYKHRQNEENFEKDFLKNLKRLKIVERKYLDGLGKPQKFAGSSDKERGALNV